MLCFGIDIGLVGAGGLAVVEDGVRPGIVYTLALPARQSGVEFFDAVSYVVVSYKPYLVMVERPWTGRRDPRPNVGLAQRERLGIVKLACEQAGLPKSRLKQVYASTMKRMVTGSGRAGKEQVQGHVQAILGLNVESEHVADALALALCGLQLEQVKRKEKLIRRELKAKAAGKQDNHNQGERR